MLDRILKLEEQLIRVEALLLVISVLLMLGLATYNVFYRNVLVPIQVSALTEDKPDVASPTEPPKSQEAGQDAPDEPAEGGEGFGGGFGDGEDDGAGFGGGFGGDEADDAVDDSGGFGGGFGDDEPAPEVTEPEAKPAEEPADDTAGFGGGFGGDEEVAAEGDPAEAEPTDDADGFGGGFGSDDDAAADSEGFGGGFDSEDTGDEDTAATDTAPATDADAVEAPREVPWVAKFVDAVKLEWIDVLLRQLVLVVGFLGAMLAARRRKHITIDALSKVLPEKVNLWVAVFTSLLSTVICLVLAKAGADLVKISIEFPKELVHWADEWQFQLAFPIGFGMLALHFGIRVIESIQYATGKAEPPEEFFEGGAI